MHIRKLAADFSVTTQITPADIPALAAEGFRAVVCNRPDGEAHGQPSFRDIAAAAQAHGLKAIHIPMSGGAGAATVAAFDAAWDALPKPVLAFCRSGVRSSNLWSASNASRQGAAASPPDSGIMGALRRPTTGV